MVIKTVLFLFRYILVYESSRISGMHFLESRTTRMCVVAVNGMKNGRAIICISTRGGDYLLVPNTPVEVCLECVMVYYEANMLKEIERHFFAIQARHQTTGALY